jgi:threonine dehydrogenase-like Zn-dependent dehydrogenase
MKAAVMRGTKLFVEEVPDPVPGPGQVLVRTIACGICGSDLHALKHADRMSEMARESTGEGLRMQLDDVVMGHEFSACVVELGPGVTGLEPGDVVVSMPVMIGGAGVGAIGYSQDYPGGYGELMLLTAGLALKVPEGLDPRRAALTEPMAVGLHAVNRSEISIGQAALVLGCGPIGLACIAALRTKGIEPIVAADFSPKRREVASMLGAHEVVDPVVEPAFEAWTRLDGSRVLHIFEAVGVPGMLDQAMGDAPRGTRITVVGVCMEPDTIRPMIGVTKELELRFCLGYDPAEFAGTLQSIASGETEVSALITGSVGIDGVPDAFETLSKPTDHVKILVEP